MGCPMASALADGKVPKFLSVFVIYSQSPKIKAGGGNSMNTKIYRCEGKEMPPAGEGVRGKKCSWPVAVVRARRLYLEQIGLIDWFFPLFVN